MREEGVTSEIISLDNAGNSLVFVRRFRTQYEVDFPGHHPDTGRPEDDIWRDGDDTGELATYLYACRHFCRYRDGQVGDT